MANGKISAGEFGVRPLTVLSIAYGAKILYVESSAAKRRSFHPKKVVPAPMTVVVSSSTYEERQDLNSWLREVCEAQVRADTTVPFLVEVLDINFHQYGILTSSIPFGRPNPGVMAWSQTLAFSVTKDPMDTTIPDGISFAMPATWHADGGAPGDYPSLYAVAVGGDEIIDRWQEPDAGLYTDVLPISAWFN